jgi:hypothetical protein
MAIIDTLKLARALHDKGGFTQEAADATAEALNAALGEDVATKSDVKMLDGRITSEANRLDSKITSEANRLDSKITMLIWAVGINAAATITMLVKHW